MSLFGNGPGSMPYRFMKSYNQSWDAYDQRMAQGLQPELPGANFSFLLGANMLYVLVTASLYIWMKRREAAGLKGFKMRRLMIAYNITCVAAAGYVAVQIIMHKISHPGTFACNPIGKTDATSQHLAFVFWVFYAQKFWEFIDTWIFVLRQSWRQVTFLHLFHHTSITLVVGSIVRFDYHGDMFLPILCNSVVHVLMYAHYACSLLGIKTWWRVYLTTMQLCQFMLISTQAIIAYKAGPTCGAPDFAKVVMVVYMASMLVLFGNFFFRQYVLKKDDASMCGVIKVADPPQSSSYSGVVTFAKDKEAIVHLPPHYDSGRHYRATISYQLTAIGAAMPNLHIVEEVALVELPEHASPRSKEALQGAPIGGLYQFIIGGGVAGKRVSWQVTAVYLAAASKDKNKTQ